ncbi:aminoglycoside 6-adenylyltransferase [Bacillus sp. BGMRC 2118]|nr:aminoglycoside 6-adenylyltransferase [Bacillus sp. BGMRC 2118]
MRCDKEMLNLILGVASKDERVRAVYMNGSRTNPKVSKDIFQDFDIVYVVTETASFIEDEEWINIFGDRIMLQEPDKLDKACGMDMDFDSSYGYLMLFTDGNRIDLRIGTKKSMVDAFVKEKLTIPLLDKDNILPVIAPPTDVDYQVKKPTEPIYISCTNNFWWCLQNVAKGIWRDELPYAKLMFQYTTRDSLGKMVSWWIGSKYDFQVSTGKMGKYFKNYLPQSYWEMYKETYSDSDYNNFWNSIFVTCELFRILSKELAQALDFTYPYEDDKNITQYLMHVRNLPTDAKEIY